MGESNTEDNSVLHETGAFDVSDETREDMRQRTSIRADEFKVDLGADAEWRKAHRKLQHL
jgi:hypothetical protein